MSWERHCRALLHMITDCVKSNVVTAATARARPARLVAGSSWEWIKLVKEVSSSTHDKKGCTDIFIIYDKARRVEWHPEGSKRA